MEWNAVGCLRAGFGGIMEILSVSPLMAKMPGTYGPGLPSTSGTWSKSFGDMLVSCDQVPVSLTESPRTIRNVPSALKV